MTTQRNNSAAKSHEAEYRVGLTRAGIASIPQGWTLRTISEIADVKTGPFGSTLHQRDYVDDGTPIITVEHLGERGIIHEGLPLVSDADRYRLSSYGLRQGDIVFSRVGSVDRSSLIREQEDGWLFSGRLLRVRVTDENVCPAYLSYHFNSEPFKKRVRDVAVGQTMASLSTQILNSVPVVLPPLQEQCAIAEALSDVDESVGALEALIYKKRAIKLGAAQELLAGRRRLPGFVEPWELKRISEFTDCAAGGTPSTLVPGYWGGDIPWMSSGELNNKVIYDVDGRITETGLSVSSAKVFPRRCVLVGLAGQGKTRGTVAINQVEVSTNQSIAAIYPNDSFVAEYLYHNLDFRYDELRELSAGDGGRGGLNLKIIRSIEVPFPTIDEQYAIAGMLSDLDKEIDTLERRRGKTLTIKQGMMQQLLTGRRRLN